MSNIDSTTNLESSQSSAEGSAVTEQGVSYLMPVVQEELSVERREVTTGTVRIRKIVHQEEQLIDEPLKATQIDVERITVNRIVDGPLPVRHEGDTAIYSVVEEVLVVTKQFVLKEELHVKNRTVHSQHRQQVTLRHEEIHVEREIAPQSQS